MATRGGQVTRPIARPEGAVRGDPYALVSLLLVLTARNAEVTGMGLEGKGFY